MWKRENLRKNFLRIRQIADQNLGRAEKSEVLSDELLSVEKRVDVVKTSSAIITKKIALCLQAQGVDVEKRLKKLPETSLGHSLIESAGILGDDTLLGQVCQMCGECESTLAREQLQYEINVEKLVLLPLQAINEVDIPAIMKIRRHLNKATLDMDSAKGRFNSAVRQSHVPGSNIAMAAAKADTIKDEYEDASNKVEYVKDSLAVEMSNFVSKETEHSSRLLALLEAQEAYHMKALEAIKSVIPKMKAAVDNCPSKPVYGLQLTEHLRVTGRDIAVVLEACIRTLLETAMDEEGLFRIAGGAMKLKKLKAGFDANIIDMEEFSMEPHVVAGALKQYLRELPEPLLTFQLHSEFMQAAQLPQNQQMQALWTVIAKLPKPNYDNFRYLVKFLSLLCEKSEVNKMTPSNIAIVIGPNLLWSQGENAPNMLTTGTLSAITEAVVMHANYFFPGDFDFADVGQPLPPGVSPQQPSFENPLYETSTPPIITPNSVQQLASSPLPPVSPSVSPSPSPQATSDSTTLSSNSLISTSADNIRDDQGSPKMQRRQTRKPAPPPPPDRPYSVAVTATFTNQPQQNISQSATWPRHAPLASPESPTESGNEEQILTDRVKPSPPEKSLSCHDRPLGPPPEKPEKPERPMGPPPARPSIPPTNHQRSLSTGANVNFIPAQDCSSGQGSLNSSQDSLNKEAGSSITSNLLFSAAPTDTHANFVSLSKTTASQSMRVTSRPIPPPPPPPINKSTEETRL